MLVTAGKIPVGRDATVCITVLSPIITLLPILLVINF